MDENMIASPELMGSLMVDPLTDFVTDSENHPDYLINPQDDLTPNISIRSDIRPGDLGLIVNLHAVAYATEEKRKFGRKFEAHIARTVADFLSEGAGQGEIFFAEQDGETIACAGLIDRSTEQKKQAQLQWLLTMPDHRKNGIGSQMMDHVFDVAHTKEFGEIFLETTSGLSASMALFKKLGFKDVIRGKKNSWDGPSSFIIMAKNL